jgi:hypothetical protein
MRDRVEISLQCRASILNIVQLDQIREASLESSGQAIYDTIKKGVSVTAVGTTITDSIWNELGYLLPKTSYRVAQLVLLKLLESYSRNLCAQRSEMIFA